jgi:hypothetical protein
MVAAEVRDQRHEKRMDRLEERIERMEARFNRRFDALTKLVHTGMKMLVRLADSQRETSAA